MQFNLEPLGGQRSAVKTTETPPTVSEAKVLMNLCGELDLDGGKADEDQCPPGTKVCLLLSNVKTSAPSDPSRITAVIPIWTTETSDSEVTLTAMNDAEGVEVLVGGEIYAGSKQSLLLRLYCSPLSTSPNPELISYTSNLLTLQWSTPDACPLDLDSGETGGKINGTAGGGCSGKGKGKDGKGSGGGMGWKWFGNGLFWMIVLGFGAYFGIGIYYNYTTYGAKGLDLLPHKEFWMDLPGMLKDLITHFVSGFRGSSGGGGGGGGSGRAGYTAL